MTTVQDRPSTANPGELAPGAGTPQRLARAPRPVPARIAAWALAALSAITVWFVCYALFVSALQESHSQNVLYSQFRQELAEQTAPLGGNISTGAPVALLSMPSAGVHDVVVVEGTSSNDLMKGPGHRRDTPLPGQVGTAVVYGRATMFGGPFRHIASAAQPGDAITVTTGQGRSHYVVEDVRYAGDPYPQALAMGAGRLTLATSAGSGWRGGWAPNAVVYVDALLTGKASPIPGGGPAAIPAEETALHGDSSALYVLVLWLPLVAAAAIGAVWARERWGHWQAWVIGVPVVLAAVWGASESAAQLLPNLM